MMKASELVSKALDVAKNCRTLYVMGCFGAPMTASNKTRYTANHAYNKRPNRTASILAASSDTFGFDCVCFIKGLLWGWQGDTSAIYGGASYGANGVPDIDPNVMIQRCSGVSTDFNGIVPGSVVWLPDHIGIYAGDGLVVECSVAWKDGVQITRLGNLDVSSADYPVRAWIKWGLLPWVDYTVEKEEEPTTTRYSRLSQISSPEFHDVVEKLMNAQIIGGDGSDPAGNDDIIDLSEDMVRLLVMAYRGGAFDARLKAAGLAPAVE